MGKGGCRALLWRDFGTIRNHDLDEELPQREMWDRANGCNQQPSLWGGNRAGCAELCPGLPHSCGCGKAGGLVRHGSVAFVFSVPQG